MRAEELAAMAARRYPAAAGADYPRRHHGRRRVSAASGVGVVEGLLGGRTLLDEAVGPEVGDLPVVRRTRHHRLDLSGARLSSDLLRLMRADGDVDRPQERCSSLAMFHVRSTGPAACRGTVLTTAPSTRTRPWRIGGNPGRRGAQQRRRARSEGPLPGRGHFHPRGTCNGQRLRVLRSDQRPQALVVEQVVVTSEG
jgi:hypothetical protein